MTNTMKKNIYSLFILVCFHTTAYAAEQPNMEAQTEPVIKPEVERRDVNIPRIDTEDFEIGYFTGRYSTEDFGSASVNGYRIAYHLTERIFFEGTHGETTITDKSFRNFLAGGLFVTEVIPLEYDYLVVGYNLFPGEVFPFEGIAWTSSFYLVAGAGNTNFNNKDHSTTVIGGGLRVLPLDWLGLHFDVREHSYESDVTGVKKTVHNTEYHLGLTVYF